MRGIARQERQRPCLGRLAIDKLLSFLNDVRRILEHPATRSGWRYRDDPAQGTYYR